MALNQGRPIFDVATRLKDLTAILATAASQVAGVDKILDVGLDAKFIGVAQVNVTALNVSAAANLYTIRIEGSDSATFAGTTVKELAILRLGHATAVGLSGIASVVGQYTLHLSNEVNGARFRYIRAHITVAGSPVTITCEIFLSKSC